MTTYRNDPRRIEARFKSTCRKCHSTINKGEDIIYWPRLKQAGHFKCDEADYLQAQASFQDEDNYNAQYR